MQKRRVTIFSFAIGVVAVAIWIGRVPEPRHHGVRLGALLDKNSVTPGSGLAELQEAVKTLGPKAVPYLTSVLEREPTPFQRWYMRNLPRLPAAVQKLAPQAKSFAQRRSRAAAALTQAGTNAIGAIPLLIMIATNDQHFGTRHNAVGTLAAVAPGTVFEAAAAIAVMSRKNDANQQLREHAYSSLGAFTNQMQDVLPTLLHGLRNPTVRESALISLRQLGTNVMPIVRRIIQNEGYLPMSFAELEREIARDP